MTKMKRIRLLIAVAGVLAVGGALLIQRRHKNLEQYRENIATVTSIDAGTRQAGLEIIHPRTGQKLTFTGTLPDECPVTIDGKSATFADIRPGDRVLLKRRGLNILAVEVRRAVGAAESAPAAGVGTDEAATASGAQ